MPIGLIAARPELLSTGSAYVTAAVTLPPGATCAGNEISIFCRSPRGSVPGLKLAVAPPTVTDFTLAFELSRTVIVRPGPLPTFVAATVATAFSTRSFCCTLALISNEVTCQITLTGV